MNVPISTFLQHLKFTPFTVCSIFVLIVCHDPIESLHMRKPDTIERLYLDFDGFFAAVEETARPALRGKPIGVIPFEHTTATMVIAANRKAKLKGVKTGVSVTDARRLCPDIALVPQSPDLYERAHRRLLLSVERVIPIDAVCSIDELTCRLDKGDIRDPHGLGQRIKARIREDVGDYLTCSIGMAPNRQLAKIAADMDKPDGLTILRPEELPGRLLTLPLEDIPGIGGRIKTRLIDAGIWTMEALWKTQPKQLRAIWGNVTGERLWYALHGYEVQALPTSRAMFGHGRVLPPEWRDFTHAFEAARLLTIKAARRLRRGKYLANTFGLWLMMKEDNWHGERRLGEANDDHAGLTALTTLWQIARRDLPSRSRIVQVHVAFYDLKPSDARQLDLLEQDDAVRRKWEKLSEAADAINSKYAKTVLSVGPWTPPPGGYAGGKIAFSRVPDMEDFW
ncbi:Y-family DNA polymerase [Gimibacter soli]|uniref:DNA-directed DNA polymerase n=1 Tax=Gimibacter soli TaxID=3024400 RepID=A0AAF0BHM6_9PROT|nr:hypothetical protein [Gimibacter soli]WCL54418.1 hypothetical protein PH603_01425 [Gimibacter soli]